MIGPRRCSAHPFVMTKTLFVMRKTFFIRNLLGTDNPGGAFLRYLEDDQV